MWSSNRQGKSMAELSSCTNLMSSSKKSCPFTSTRRSLHLFSVNWISTVSVVLKTERIEVSFHDVVIPLDISIFLYSEPLLLSIFLRTEQAVITMSNSWETNYFCAQEFPVSGSKEISRRGKQVQTLSQTSIKCHQLCQMLIPGRSLFISVLTRKKKSSPTSPDAMEMAISQIILLEKPARWLLHRLLTLPLVRPMQAKQSFLVRMRRFRMVALLPRAHPSLIHVRHLWVVTPGRKNTAAFILSGACHALLPACLLNSNRSTIQCGIKNKVLITGDGPSAYKLQAKDYISIFNFAIR